MLELGRRGAGGYLLVSARLEEHQCARSGRRSSTWACFGESPKLWWKDDSHQELGFSAEPANQQLYESRGCNCHFFG